MRNLLIILVIFIGLNTNKAESSIDSIKKESIVTNWTEHNDYYKSNINVIDSGYIRDYGQFILYKYHNSGILIQKSDGSAFKKIYQNRYFINSISDRSWDMSPTDTSKFIIVEFSNSGGVLNNIFQYSDSKSELLYRWATTGGQSTHGDQEYMNHVYILNDSLLLVQNRLNRNRGPYLAPFTVNNIINHKSNEIKGLLGFNLKSMISYNNKVFMCSNDNDDTDIPRRKRPMSHDFFKFENGKLSRIQSIENGREIWYKDIINDSLCVYSYKDTTMIYNYIQNTFFGKYYSDSRQKPKGVYWNDDRNTIDIAFEAIGDSTKIISIHYPSKNLIKNENVVAPYLGRFVMNTGDGYTLSVGHGGYLYKHDLSVFKSDSLTADFSYKNTANYELQFSDESFGAIIDWRWDFGDGNTSSERHPIHKFASAGKYEVELIITDEYGNKDSITKQVKVTQKLKSSFDFGLFSGQAPFTVQFKNYSSENAVRYIWNFGDGTYSYEMEPAHTYNIPGEFSVSLTVFDENEKFHTIVQPKRVVVTE